MWRPRLQALSAYELRDLRYLGEVIAAVLATWLLLGTDLSYPITHRDGAALVMPYVQSSLHAGTAWTDHLYRFGVLGGSKMHEFGGTMPIVQLCAALGLATTTTVNVITLFVQVCFGFLGIKCVDSLVHQWSSGARHLTSVERITTISFVSFAPVLGWRLAFGHENLLIGLLPLLATAALLWSARTDRLSITALLVAAFAVANAVSGLSAQTVVYSAVFASPLIIMIVLDAPKGHRWGPREWTVTAALLAGVLIVLPRLSVMIAHAVSEDASRALSESVTYSFGAARWIDWLTSVPWTSSLAITLGGVASVHEHNYPLGPPLLLLIFLWPSRHKRRMLWALLACVVVAVFFANGVRPVSSALLAAVPPLQAFRVPARAVLPLAVLVPVFALAAVWARRPSDSAGSRAMWVSLGVAGLIVAFGSMVPDVLRETIAWIGCAGLTVVSWRWPDRLRYWPMMIVAALGIVSFHSRFPTEPVEPTERSLHALHTSILEHAPELRTAFDRVVMENAPSNDYQMSMLWAAELPAMDAVWYPPRRFLELVGTLDGIPLDPTSCAFQLTRISSFPLLQQLYNVRYLIRLSGEHSAAKRMPSTPGAAWFPSQIELFDDPATMGDALHRRNGPELIRTTAWLSRADRAPIVVPASCAQARVISVSTDARGQTATFHVDAPAECPLLISANYVSTFRAFALSRDQKNALEVFPLDIALTGVLVPPGASTIVLEPLVTVASWARTGQWFGIALLLSACVAVLMRSREVRI